MKNWRKWFCGLALCGAMSASVMAADTGVKIGVVNMERILRESVSAQVASDRLNEESRQRQREIELLSQRFKERYEHFEKESPTMTEARRVAERRALAETERDISRRNREARDEFNQRRNEEVMWLQSRAARVIQRIAKKEKFDLVLFESFYASERIDITNRVIQALDKDQKKNKEP